MTTTHDLPPLPCSYTVDILPSHHRNDIFTAEQMELYALSAIAPYKAEIERLKRATAEEIQRLNAALDDAEAEVAKLRELLAEAKSHAYGNDCEAWLIRIDAALGEKP